jgi:hypothetical protein
MFTAQQKAIVTESTTTAYKEVLAQKMKQMDARRIVPFMAKGEAWSSILKYWIAKGNTEINIKSKTDTEGNNINLQMATIDSEIPRFPIEIKIPWVVYKEYENNKAGLFNYLKAHIETGIKAYNLFVNDFCLKGQKDTKFTGLVNDDDLDVYNFAETLASAGPALFKEINKFLQTMVSNSEKAFEPNQLAVSTNIYTALVSTTVGTNEITLLDKLLKESPYLRNSTLKETDVIIQLSELDGAGAGGKDRFVALADSENGTNFHFEETMQLVPGPEGFDDKQYYKTWENRSGGLMIDQLKSINYGDVSLTA